MANTTFLLEVERGFYPNQGQAVTHIRIQAKFWNDPRLLIGPDGERDIDQLLAEIRKQLLDRVERFADA